MFHNLLVDAGWIGTAAALSTAADDPNPAETLKTMKHPTLADSGKRLAAVAGTSTCHIVQVSSFPHIKDGDGSAFFEADSFLFPVRSFSLPRESSSMGFGDLTRTPCKLALYYLSLLLFLAHPTDSSFPFSSRRVLSFPGWWMNEGGQSSTGQLIDFMIKTHPAYPELVEVSKKEGKNMFDVLGERLESMRVSRGEDTLTDLTRDLHLVSLLETSFSRRNDR